LHLENCFYFVGAGLDTLGGNQTAQYFASHYSEDTFLGVEFDVGLVHIIEGFHQVGDVQSFVLACDYDIIDVRVYVPANLVL
jgi:hypothetical protein